MFRTTRSAARTSRPRARLSLCYSPPLLLMTLCALLLVGLGLGHREARAQTPPRPMIRVGVVTDRVVYRPGEPIQLKVVGTNPSDQPITLGFGSACMANYGFEPGPDGTAYNWLNDRACATVASSVSLAPGATRDFGAFSHTPDLFHLTPGRHELWGEVVGFGRASTVIVVGDSIPGDSPIYRMAPRVEPVVAGPGDVIRFGLTVANASNSPRTFVVDGCPVQLNIDGWWEPRVACIEIARTITLQPGQSVDFSAADYPYLAYDPNLGSTAPLQPGRHKALLGVRGVGAVPIEFTISGDGGGGATGGISGVISDLMGEAVPGAVVSALTYWSGPDSLPPPPDGDPTGGRDPNGGNGGTGGGPGDPGPSPFPRFHGSATTGPDGRYLIADVPPGRYQVWAMGRDGGVTWYNNVPYPEQATPVDVSDKVVDGIDITLKPGVPPPPPLPGVIEGTILTWIPPGSEQPQRPIPGAVVVALFRGSPIDTVIGPNDSTGVVGPGWGTDGRPVEPPDPWGLQRFYGYTDEVGHFRIEVPFGAFHLVAGHVAYRYQWSGDADRLEDAQPVVLDTAHPVATTNFQLKTLPADPTASLTGVVYTRAGRDSTDGRPDEDPATGTGRDGRVGLPGAQVSALPLIADPRLMIPVQLFSATTDDDGRFVLSAPANSPYVVQASAAGYLAQFFDHTGDFWAARPVDVAPGATTSGLEFDLARDYYPPPPEGGVLGGRVTTPDAGPVDADGQVGALPVPNALVRVRAADAGYGLMEIVTRTDERGFWYLSGLALGRGGQASGRYIVSAEAEGFVPTYHPQAYRAADAVPVEPISPYLDRLPEVDISLVPQPVDGAEFVAARVRSRQNVGWGEVPPDGGRPGAPRLTPLGETPPVPPDSLGGDLLPLLGAYVFLVSVDPAPSGTEHLLAGGVSCDNGTLVLTGLPAGSYKAYADRPGFATQWFGGTSRATATVFRLGAGAPGVLLDFTLESLDGLTPPPGGGAGGDTDAAAPMTNLRNAPNPSKPQTTIMYRLNARAAVSLRIFDVNGRLVRTLFENSPQDTGEQNVPWDGKGDDGATVGAGMYFYQVQTAQKTATGKMVVVR